MFLHHANLLSEQARQVWDKVVKDQTESETYTDVYGNEKAQVAGNTLKTVEQSCSGKNDLEVTSFHDRIKEKTQDVPEACKALRPLQEAWGHAQDSQHE